MMPETVESVFAAVVDRNPGEPDFHQAPASTLLIKEFWCSTRPESTETS
ncbi:hypothetical protein ACIBMZ_17710 [Micromonospora sp. NPDC049900]